MKPLVTEAPLQTKEGVTVLTLEKLLVGINKDADFSYLHSAEAERMVYNAKALYILTTPAWDAMQIGADRKSKRDYY